MAQSPFQNPSFSKEDRFKLALAEGNLNQLRQIDLTLTKIAASLGKVQTQAKKTADTWLDSWKKLKKGLDEIGSNLSKMTSSIIKIGAVTVASIAGATAVVTSFAEAASPDAYDTLTGSLRLLSAEIGVAFVPVILKASYIIQGVAAYIHDMSPDMQAFAVKWGMIGIAIAAAGAVAIFVLPAIAASVSIVVNTIGLAVSTWGLFASSVAFFGLPIIGIFLAIAAAVGLMAYQLNTAATAGSSLADSMANYGKEMSKEQYEADPAVEALRKTNAEERVTFARRELEMRQKEYDLAKQGYLDSAAAIARSPITGGVSVATGGIQANMNRLQAANEALVRGQVMVEEANNRQHAFGAGSGTRGVGVIDKATREWGKLMDKITDPNRHMLINRFATPSLGAVQDAWRQAQMASARGQSQQIDQQIFTLQQNEFAKFPQYIRDIINGIRESMGLRPIGPTPNIGVTVGQAQRAASMIAGMGLG